MIEIHQTALVDSHAKIADGVRIGAFAIIERGVEIAEDCIIEPYARICSGAKIAKKCKIGSFTTVSGLPQDLRFDESTISYVEIGEGTIVREGSTIHRATLSGGATIIGKNCFLMANSHLAHDVRLADRVIAASFCAIAGFASIGEDTFISGGVMIHQKTRIGCGAMLSGNSAISLDVPPFVNAFSRNDIAGLNLIGLMRRNATRQSISNIKELYHFIYGGGSPRKRAIEAIEQGLATTNEGKIFADFFAQAPEGRHFIHPSSKDFKGD